MANNRNRTRRALNLVVKHQSQKTKPSNRPNALKRNINLGSLVIAHPDLYRNEWYGPARKRAEYAMLGLALQIAGYKIPIRNIEPSLLRKLHRNGSLAIALAEHEYWDAESDPEDVLYYLKHSKGHLIGIGQAEALTLLDLSERQQIRIIKAALCGHQPFRATGLDSKYTVMGEILVNLWNVIQQWSDFYDEEEIRTRLLRAVLKAYRHCHKPRSTIQTSRRTVNSAVGEIDRLFASPLTTNTVRNRAAAEVRRVVASVPRSRLPVVVRALELAMRDFSRYLKTRYWYIDPFLSPYADIFKTIFKSV